MDQPDLDVGAFAVQCFNEAWRLLDQAERSAEEDGQMIRLSPASHGHWTQREDCTPTNVSVAYWQTSKDLRRY